MNNFEKIKGQLIVSCQALPNEPLHSSFIMGRMALAAQEGGGRAIRANTAEDIREIKSVVNLPVIGIVKRDYDDSSVFITATMKEIDELTAVGCDIIAIDATKRLRPNGQTLDDFYQEIRSKYPEQALMADCSTLEEAVHADALGFEFIGTTLIGYTHYSPMLEPDEHLVLIQEIINQVQGHVIAEGNINTPEMARKVLDMGSYAVVVGSAITRPQLITKRFAEAIHAE